jgi:hypothetical protein
VKKYRNIIKETTQASWANGPSKDEIYRRRAGVGEGTGIFRGSIGWVASWQTIRVGLSYHKQKVRLNLPLLSSPLE